MERLRNSFALRWLVAVSAAMTVAGVVSYVLLARQLEAELLVNAAHQIEDDAHVMERRLAAESDPASRRRVLREHAEELALPGHVPYVGVYDADGDLVYATGPGPAHLDRDLAAAALSGQVVFGKEEEAGEVAEHRYEFVAPLDSPDGTLLLEVDQQPEELVAVLDRLRGTTSAAGAGALLVAVPLSYLFGGASLRRRHREASRLAETDELTGLPARRGFRPTLEAALMASNVEVVSLALVDLDDFKTVNDRLGHSYGDRVLVATATSFDALRGSDTAFRLGRDEFAVVLPGVDDTGAAAIVERVRAQLRKRSSGITFSAGVASQQRGEGLTIQELWERADAALYEAKRRGRARTVAFSGVGAAVAMAPEKLDAIADLAAWRHQLEVVFQPIWDLRSGTVLGHEALLRLPGDLPFEGPAEAFSIAERLGMAGALDEAARAVALQALARHGATEGRIFLNVHPEAVRGLDLDALREAVAAAGLPVEQVVLEVTEQAELGNRSTSRVLKRAQAMGFKVALDDLGHGNAGLHALTRLRFDVLKLDRLVVTRLGIDPAADATMAAAVTFVQGTGGLLVAEGIEDAVRLDAVMRSFHPRASAPPAMAGQGFLLGRPASAPRPSGDTVDLRRLVEAESPAALE